MLARRLKTLSSFAFAEIDQEVAKLRAADIDIIDFGVGDPTAPTPEFIRKATQKAVDEHACSGYPSYIGSEELRQTIAAFYKKRFACELDPATQISVTLGSKEAIFHVHEGIIDPGDVVLIPNPGYPPYARGTRFAEGVPYFYSLSATNGFLPDFSSIPQSIVSHAKAMWINYPNAPTGAVASENFFQNLVTFARKHNLILLSDEAYSEIYFTDKPPLSLLQFGREKILVFNSLSKRSAMTGYRVGWVAGDSELVASLRKVKTNLDSGVPNFVQAGAIAALIEETHVAQMREDYQKKRDILLEALQTCGLPACSPQGTFYIWQRLPAGMQGSDFVKQLLRPQIALVAMPGAWLAETDKDGKNPGENFVRFALVPPLEKVIEAAERLRKLSW